jgi:Tfp pilus assembly protein PilV
LNVKHPARSAKRPLSGLTLLEVVAAIAILGTVLVGLVLAKARHVRQLAEARRLSAAVRAADSLLADWWTRPEGVPDNESGPVGTDGSLVYATREVPSAAVERLTCRVVRVEIRQAATQVPGAETPDEPLVAVELVLPSREGRP